MKVLSKTPMVTPFPRWYGLILSNRRSLTASPDHGDRVSALLIELWAGPSIKHAASRLILGFSSTTNPVQYSLMCWYVSIRGNKSRYGANPSSMLGGIATMGTIISFLSVSHWNRTPIIGTHGYLSPAQFTLK